MNPLAWVGVVLAGGASRRMGRDKALIDLDGEALVARSCRALADAGADEVLVVGGDLDAVAELDLGTTLRCSLRLVPDTRPGEGPLGGVVTAIDSIDRPVAIVVLACDLPFVSSDQVRLLVDSAPDAAADVLIPVVADRPQYLHSLWMPSSHATVQASFRSGARAMRAPLDDGLRTHLLRPAEVDPYRDVDTPSELADIGRVGSLTADTPEENSA